MGDTDGYKVVPALKTFLIELERSSFQSLLENDLPKTLGIAFEKLGTVIQQ